MKAFLAAILMKLRGSNKLLCNFFLKIIITAQKSQVTMKQASH